MILALLSSLLQIKKGFWILLLRHRVQTLRVSDGYHYLHLSMALEFVTFSLGMGLFFCNIPLDWGLYYEHKDVCVCDSLKNLLILDIIYLKIFPEMTTKSEKNSLSGL